MTQELSYSEQLITCSVCGASVHKFLEIETDPHDDTLHPVCSSCFPRFGYMICTCCCEAINTDVESWVTDSRDRIWCESCIESEWPCCEHCDDVIDPTQAYTTSDGGHICDRCYEQEYGYCDSCGELFRRSCLHWSDGNVYCACCCHNDSNNWVHTYNYKFPQESVKFLDATIDPNMTEYVKPRGYGWEIEIDDGYYFNCTNAIHEYDPYETKIFMKEDGSLSEAGIEIVSHVATKDFWLNSTIIPDVCDIARQASYKSHDCGTCGFHIHASRTLFGESQDSQGFTLAKLLMLLDRMWLTTIKISRRSEYSMNEWCRSYNLERVDSNEVASKACHYMIVSITAYTYELRMFRGTLKPESIYAAIEFYDSLIKLAKRLTTEQVLTVRFNDIRPILIKDTKYLDEYLTQRGIPAVEDGALPLEFQEEVSEVMKTPVILETLESSINSACEEVITAIEREHYTFTPLHEEVSESTITHTPPMEECSIPFQSLNIVWHSL